MVINFPIPNDNQYHQYCLACRAEAVERIFDDGKTFYKCRQCQAVSPRSIVIDPQIVWWIDKRTNEYWHKSVGIFLYNNKKEILLFERTIYPFALTIPSGHLDADESPKEAVVREVSEETGINLMGVRLFSEESVVGDECRRGADSHYWHLYTAKIDGNVNIIINDEGIKPVWLSLDAAILKKITFPVKYFIGKYGVSLIKD